MLIEMIEIPIYECFLYLIIDKPEMLLSHRSEASFVEKFGPPPKEFSGCCSYNDLGSFALFLSDDSNIKTISHEIYHLTRRILEYISANDEQECGAYLNGYLNEIVHERFKKIKEIV